MMIEALGLIASVAMGVTLGLMGGGGSVLTVPIMVYLFGLAPTLATSYSLFVVGLTALVGGLIYLRTGDIDYKVGFAFAIPSILGVNLARGLLIPQLPDIIFSFSDLVVTKDVLIMVAFAGLMVLASLSMIRPRQEAKPIETAAFRRVAVIAGQGLLVGLIAGFVGAGGGFLIIPALVFFAGLKMRVAVGTSLLIIAAQSLFGFAGDIARGSSIDWKLLGAVALAAVVGILGGSGFGHKIQEQSLKVTFGWFVLLMGATILLEQIYRTTF